MRKMYYVGGYVLVADRTCTAVLHYSRALAHTSTSDIVHVPVITEGGSHAYADLLIGPASELFSTPVENSYADDPIDEDTIAHIEQKTRRLEPARSPDVTDVPFDAFDFPDLFLLDQDAWPVA